MIKYETILKAKNGDMDAMLSIINYYSKAIRDFSNDDDFYQMAVLNIIQGTRKFKIKKI